jgi:transaldolase/transaldolase/glucose-6-phosphate isomerase
MNNGELKKLIDEDGIRGVTSNPAIFEKAISSSDDYNEDIIELSQKKKATMKYFMHLPLKTFSVPLIFLNTFMKRAMAKTVL